jgi:hypothetical protein
VMQLVPDFRERHVCKEVDGVRPFSWNQVWEYRVVDGEIAKESEDSGFDSQAGYHLTQVLLHSPARGVSCTLRPHPWRVVVCVWSAVVLNNSAPSLAVTGWLQDQCCDTFYD